MRSRRKTLSYTLEGAALLAVFGLFRVLPVDIASALAGGMGRWLGPRLGVSKRARANLVRVFPDASAAEREAIIKGMWDNLFRIGAEYPHLPRIARERRRFEVVGAEHVDRIAAEGRGILFVSAHYGNWEVASIPALHHGLEIHLVERPPNNPTAAWLTRRLRRHTATGLLPKGGGAARRIMRILKGGGVVGILADQKLSQGISAPFLGHAAMTSTAVADLAIATGAAAIPVRVERTRGSHFRIVVQPPLQVDRTARPRDAEVRRLTCQINDILGEWIRARPEQWLWLHRRWPETNAPSQPAPARQSTGDRDVPETS